MGTRFDHRECFFHEPPVSCSNGLREGPHKNRCVMDKRCPHYVPAEWMAPRVANFVHEQAYIYSRRRIYGAVHDTATNDELKGDDGN